MSAAAAAAVETARRHQQEATKDSRLTAELRRRSRAGLLKSSVCWLFTPIFFYSRICNDSLSLQCACCSNVAEERSLAICSLLGVSPPDYRFYPDQRAPGFHSGAAFFPNDPLIGAGGPVGEVRNVYGKKAAKEECAKGVLQYLGNIVEERKAKAREVIRLSEGILA